MPMIRRRRGERGIRWQWRVTIHGHPPRYGTCPTRTCAEACAKKAEESIRQGRILGRLTLAEIIDRYAESYLPKIPDSAAMYRRHLAFWRTELGDYAASVVTAPIIAEARDHLRRTPGRGGRLRSASTVNRYLTTLSSVYAWAQDTERGYVDRNPVREVKPLPEPPGRVRFLSRPVDEELSELTRLLAACEASESPILFDVVVLLLCTGCRESEVLWLRRSDIRLAEGGFTLPKERTKTEQARFVPLEGPALEVVQRRLKIPAFGSPFVFAGRKRARPAGFPWRAWRTALRRAGISDFRPHDLRHTHGSYLGMLGKSLPEIMAALGHKTPTVALRYVHLADERKRGVTRDVVTAITEWTHADSRPS